MELRFISSFSFCPMHIRDPLSFLLRSVNKQAVCMAVVPASLLVGLTKLQFLSLRFPPLLSFPSLFSGHAFSFLTVPERTTQKTHKGIQIFTQIEAAVEQNGHNRPGPRAFSPS